MNDGMSKDASLSRLLAGTTVEANHARARAARAESERDTLKAERDDLLRMNLNLTEECEQKHRLIEGLKVDRDSRDEEIDALKAENATLRAELTSERDYFAEWSEGNLANVELERTNATLRATIERARELADDADCMDCSLSLHIRDVLDAVVHLENTNDGNDQ